MDSVLMENDSFELFRRSYSLVGDLMRSNLSFRWRHIVSNAVNIAIDSFSRVPLYLVAIAQ